MKSERDFQEHLWRLGLKQAELSVERAQLEVDKARTEKETAEMTQRHVAAMIAQDRNPLADN